MNIEFNLIVDFRNHGMKGAKKLKKLIQRFR